MNKKISIFIITLLISFNSLAAVVSDSDGSAFITKKEFEGLKNDFNKQITRYNLSIDNKIDGAIASYLDGIKLDEKEHIDFPLKNWGTITMMNGTIKPIFSYPSANLSAYFMGGYWANYLDNWIDEAWAFGNATYEQDMSQTSIRPTIKNVSEDGSDDTKMTWDGVKTKWKEKISSNYNQGGEGSLYAYEVSGYDNRIFLYQMACFEGPGYIENLDNSIASIWKVNYGYYSNYASFGYHPWTDGSYILAKNLVFGVEVNDSDTIYKHVCNWNNSFAHWEVYNEKFRNTFMLSNYDTLKANDWFDLMAKKGIFYAEKVGNKISSSRNVARFSTLTVSNTTYDQKGTDYSIPRIGLYNLDVEPKNIYQTYDRIVQTIDKDEMELPKLNLVDGFVLFYAKYGDEIEWSPVFSRVSSSETGLIDNNTEVCLMLSMVPFEDGTVTEGIGDNDLISVYNFGATTQTKYPTSVDKKMKLKWTMPKDGFVYAKWYPVLSDSNLKDTKSWRCDLDLTSCGTYSRFKAD